MGNGLSALAQYDELLEAFTAHNMTHPGKLLPLQAALSVATLQLLLSTPPEQLLQMGPKARAAFAYASFFSKQTQGALLELQQEDGGPAGALTQVREALQPLAEVAAAVLEKLLGMCRALPDSANHSTGRGSSGRGSSRAARQSVQVSDSDRDLLLQCCSSAADALASGLVASAEAGVWVRLAADGVASAEGAVSQPAAAQQGSRKLLPVSCGQVCKLLEEFVRLALAAAAASPPSSSEAASKQFGRVMDTIHFFFEDDPAIKAHRMSQADTDLWEKGGPLVAPVAAAGDAGSPDAQQLYGLLASVLKVYSSTSTPAIQSLCSSHVIMPWTVTNLIHAANHVVLPALDSSSGSSSSSGGLGKPACALVLPWLVLLGRCCFASAALMQHWRHFLEVGNFESGPQNSWMSPTHLGIGLRHLHCSLDKANKWLAAPGPSQQLTALGYQPQDLQQQLEAARPATLWPDSERLDAVATQIADPVTRQSNAAAAAGMLQDFETRLQAAGKALTCFAVPGTCNNPGCVNVSGPSEAQLVCARRNVCAGCRCARYCAQDPCQRAHWRQHKQVCKALAAAAAAGGGAAAPAAAAAAAAAGGGGGGAGGGAGGGGGAAAPAAATAAAGDSCGGAGGGAVAPAAAAADGGAGGGEAAPAAAAAAAAGGGGGGGDGAAAPAGGHADLLGVALQAGGAGGASAVMLGGDADGPAFTVATLQAAAGVPNMMLTRTADDTVEVQLNCAIM
jgi:hypothetical protein